MVEEIFRNIATLRGHIFDNYQVRSWATSTTSVTTQTLDSIRPGDLINKLTLIARFMGPAWGPPGAVRTQGGPMLATRTLLSG